MPKGVYQHKPLSELHRKHISEALKNTYKSDEYRHKLSEAHKGRVFPEEVRRKISESHLKLNLKGERSFHYGKKRTPEVIKRMSEAQMGSKNANYKGGRHTKYGYVEVRIYPDNFFFPMAGRNGFVREHRLVMAKHINRCLLPWEVVHHRNGVKDDNRIENLQLLYGKDHLYDTNQKRHIHLLESKIKKLEAQIAELKRGKHDTHI